MLRDEERGVPLLLFPLWVRRSYRALSRQRTAPGIADPVSTPVTALPILREPLTYVIFLTSDGGPMDKVISARVDETVAGRIGVLAHRLRLSKKKVIENAVELYATQVETEGKHDSLREAFGAWERKESAAETAETARKAFRKSMERHRR
jgi:hypothetical protein